MEKTILSYRVIIEPEKMGRKTVYNAYCPTLELADYGDTIDETVASMKSLIKFHIECLLKEGIEIPMENTEKEIILSTQVSIKGSGEKVQVLVA